MFSRFSLLDAPSRCMDFASKSSLRLGRTRFHYSTFETKFVLFPSLYFLFPLFPLLPSSPLPQPNFHFQVTCDIKQLKITFYVLHEIKTDKNAKYPRDRKMTRWVQHLMCMRGNLGLDHLNHRKPSKDPPLSELRLVNVACIAANNRYPVLPTDILSLPWMVRTDTPL